METITTNDDSWKMKYKNKPMRHQLDCLNRFGNREQFALLAEQGTGKTYIIINNIADLWSDGSIDGVLVFAPNGVHSNWTRIELPKHMPDWVRWKAADWCSAPNKKEKSALEALWKPEPSQLRILTMNWEGLQHKRSYEFAEKFANSCGRLMIVCDESDAAKNPKAERTKNLMKLRKFSRYRRIMTGTPINNAPFDAFSQFSFLDENILGTTSFYAFKAEYAELLQPGNPLLDAIQKKSGGRFTPQVVAKGANGRPKYRNLEKLSRLLEPHSFRVLKKDCLDLPDKIYKSAFFELTKEQKAVYDKAEKECRLSFEKEETTFNKLVAVGKLAQITSGYYLHPLSTEPVRIPGGNPKIDLLVDRVRAATEGGEKVIVWARFKVEIEDIVAALRAEGLETVEYHGDVGKADRQAAIDAMENGSAQVFVGNQQAGGTGITIVSASVVIYFSNDFSLRNRLQSEDRAHRIGQTRNVTYWDLAAKGTIDEAVIRSVQNKKSVSEQIVDKGFDLFKKEVAL